MDEALSLESSRAWCVLTSWGKVLPIVLPCPRSSSQGDFCRASQLVALLGAAHAREASLRPALRTAPAPLRGCPAPGPHSRSRGGAGNRGGRMRVSRRRAPEPFLPLLKHRDKRVTLVINKVFTWPRGVCSLLGPGEPRREHSARCSHTVRRDMQGCWPSRWPCVPASWARPRVRVLVRAAGGVGTGLPPWGRPGGSWTTSAEGQGFPAEAAHLTCWPGLCPAYARGLLPR